MKNSAISLPLLVVLFCFLSLPNGTPAGAAGARENLDCLGKGADGLLYDYLLRISEKQYRHRAREVRMALCSPQAVARRRERLRRDYRRIIGDLPKEKCPLNPQVTGVIQCDGYRIEKVHFESRPDHHVTANLYVPATGKGPFPAVAVPCGHSHIAKACEAYQKVCALLAKNGFVALIYDPISQGERHQVKAPRHGTATHSFLDIGSLLVGRTVVGYEAWDGMRSIDYLLSRDEVDKDKPIGVTGNSGGGTQTTYLMALDERVGPAGPSCFVMRQQDKFETIGPADGCQHLPGAGACGIDQIDYLWIHSPEPALILAAEQDFFDFESTKDAAKELKKLYQALGKPERAGLFSYDDKHGFSRPRRQAAVRWMKRWILNKPEPVIEPELNVHTFEQLKATKTGQVVTAFKNESTVKSMNLRRAKALAGKRKEFWNRNSTKKCLEEIRRLVGLSDRRSEPNIEKIGHIHRGYYRILKLVIRRKEEVPVPALLFVPEDAPKNSTAVIYVDGRGKSYDAAEGGLIERLVDSGHIVLSIDARGFGETAGKDSEEYGFKKEYRAARVAIHVGRPLLGQRVEDVLAAADFISSREDVGKIHLMGVERAGPVVLHAAAIDERFKAVTLRSSIQSWIDDVLAGPPANRMMGYVVPAALLKYDLPDLAGLIESRGADVTTDKPIPRPEHPKPQFKRKTWMNLNGWWDFAMDFNGIGIEQNWQNKPEKFEKNIRVPFCVESKLSGIGYTDFIKTVWYRRTFRLPDDWKGKRIFLNFGGVDYECRAWINGSEVGRHYGGSDSFEFEMTQALQQGKNRIVVYAFDDVRSGLQPSGKQSTQPESHGVFYTRVTGIWQTVWLEARASRFLDSVHIIPDLDGSRFIVKPVIEGYERGLEFRAALLEDGKVVSSARREATNNSTVILKIENPRVWSNNDPYLYDLRLELLADGKVIDSVMSYAGLRKFHIEGNRFYLNNRPLFLRFVLDQGFYPDGIWTAPSDKALKKDIQLSMKAGFNGARLHQKVFEERFHYWADRLGYLTWGEFADWGRDRDCGNPQRVLNIERQWRDVVLRDRNHPSILAWTPFNETARAARKNYRPYRRAVLSIRAATRALDSTRPINDASGYVHVKTDIFTVHDYEQDPEVFKKRYARVSPECPEKAFVRKEELSVPYQGRPYVVDEYGGTFWTEDYVNHPEKAGSSRRNWGYGKTREQVENRIKALTDILLENPDIAGFTYTQLTDVEQEVNGIYTYRRKPKFNIEKLNGIFGAPAAVEYCNSPAH